MKKLIVSALAIAMAASLSAAPVQGATIEELQAMIASLQAQLAALIGGGTTGGTAYVFNVNLTIGSTGADVTELQQYLVANGYLQMPAGVAYGYFGPLTRAAVAKWQAANGISPAVGYFGPISRARLNSMVGTPGTGTPGTGTPGTTPGITTPGVEGVLTARINPTPGAGTKFYEGDSMRAVLGIEVEAQLSDIRVERVKLQLDATSPNSDTQFYTKIARRVYITDESGNVLGSADLNSSTVIDEGSTRSITIANLSPFIVSKDTKKVLIVKMDAFSSWDSTYDGDSWTVTVPVDGVRGIDGAGVNQYSPSTGNSFSRNFTTEGELIDNATLQLSLNTNSPDATEIVASQGADEDELDEFTLLTFDLRAEKDDVLVTDLAASFTQAGVASASTTYLYDGSTLIGSASVSSGTATFSDIDYTVPAGTTKTLTLKVDLRDAAATATTFSVSITGSSQVTAENSVGDTVTASGSATSETMTVRNVGPQFALVSRSIEKSSTPINNNTSTSTAKGTFNVKITAVGGDITFGTQSASTTFGFATYAGGSASTLLVASTTSFTTPSSGVITSGLCGNCAFKLQENNSVTLPVEFLFEGRTTAGALVSTNSYAIGMTSIAWSADAGASSNTSTFMNGELDWRTSAVSLP